MSELAARLAQRREGWADALRPWMFLGSGRNAEDMSKLGAHGVTHVLNVADDVPNFHEAVGGLTYRRLEVGDFGQDAGISRVFADAADFLRLCREDGGVALVHCANGSNRSATVAIAVLMQLEGMTLREAFDLTRERHRATAPLRKESAELVKFEIETLGVATMAQDDFLAR